MIDAATRFPPLALAAACSVARAGRIGLAALALVGGALVGGLSGVAPALADAALLQHDPMVDDKFITLGDLFINIPDDLALTAVAHAPSPGKTTEVPLNVLMQLSKKYRLGWQPVSIHQKVVVLRASQIIDQPEIERLLRREILNRMAVADDVVIHLDNPNAVIHLPTDEPAAVAVEKLDLQRQTGRFVATLVAPIGKRGEERMTISGVMRAMVRVPVAANRIGKNDLITGADVVFETRPANRVNSRVLTALDDIVGMSPKRGIGVGDTFESSSLKSMPLVLKGASVSLIYSTRNMRLTALGRALSEGGLNETVRVTNTQSNRTVAGVVTGPNQVTVTRPDMPLQPYTAER